MTFRFYGPLNDFLPAELRQRRFVRAMGGRRSAKDAIEALGVPHPEIDVILVNGQTAGFDTLLGESDDVAVYPVFRAAPVPPTMRAGVDPPRPVRFACDIHLRKLASLLRLCGWDAELLEHDPEVAAAAAGDGRVALTRDVGLLKRSIVRHGYWVRETDPERQLAEVVNRFDLAADAHPFSRCLRCNTPLIAADASSVAGKVPDQTLDCFTEFSRCPGCGRVYWKGSHYDRLARLVERVVRSQPRSAGQSG